MAARPLRSMTPFWLAPVLLGIATLFGSASAAAAPPPEVDDEGAYRPEYERRRDFTIGASAGALLGSATGYPNEAAKIGNPQFVADPGPGVGYHYTVWLGGALRDWFTFALGIDALAYERKGFAVAGSGFVFRVEFFPFFDALDIGPDLGAFGSFGLGGLTIKEGDATRADGGAMSLVGLGAFYEPIRFGGFSAGPQLEYQRLFSQTLEMQAVTLGFRLAFYAGP